MKQINGFGNRNQLSTGKKILFIVGICIFIGAIGAAGYFYYQYSVLKSNPATVAEEKSEKIIDKVGKLYALPDEKPTIAEISDREKLKGQAFFDKSENGDALLIFPNAKLAIIYRDKTNQLINVGPISLSEETEKK